MSEITQIKDTIADLEDQIRKKNAVLKLESVPEFAELILEGFMKDEVVRSVALSTDPRLSPDKRANALADAQAAGFLNRYLIFTVQIGIQAENSIIEARETLAELMAGG